MPLDDDLIQLRPAGLYCPAGDFHIDPWLPVPHAVITHAHSDHARPDSGVYHAADAGLALLRARLGDVAVHAHRYGERFTLGDATVSLHPAGHVLGSAQVRVEARGETWVVSGDYKRAADPTCAPFEPQRCDVFVTEATFALPVYRWPATADVVADIVEWWDGCAARGETALLYCYALGKAQRLLAELRAQTDRTVLLHGALVEPVALYRAAGIEMLPTLQWDAGDPVGVLVMAPPSAAGSPWLRRFKRLSTGFVSGWMQVRGNRRRRSVDRGFVLSDHADWPALLQTIADTGARRVLAMHGITEPLVRHLRDRGLDADTLRSAFERTDDAPIAEAG